MQYLRGRTGGILNRLRSAKLLRDEARLCLRIAFPFTPEESSERWRISGDGAWQQDTESPGAAGHTRAVAATSDYH